MNKKTKKPKVCIGTVEVSGFGRNLSLVLNKIGIDTTQIELEIHPNYKNKTSKLLFQRIIYFLNKSLSQNTSSRFNVPIRMLLLVLRLPFQFFIFLWALVKFDTFIFLYGSTFLPKKVFKYLDWKILKLFNKKIIVVLMGTDSRPPFLGGTVLSTYRDSVGTISVNPTHLHKKCREIKSNLNQIENIADYVVSNPLSSQFLTKKFVNFVKLGFPFSVSPQPILDDNNDDNSLIKILHAPSCRHSKGSDKFLSSINKLKKKGYNIEYKELVGETNTQVLAEIKNCDFVLDQLYTDSPINGFATEAASFGKTVASGAYVYGQIQSDWNCGFTFPLHLFHPDHLDEAIEMLINDAEKRNMIGKGGREMLLTRNSEENIAQRYSDLINDKLATDYFLNPNDLQYVFGGGVSKENIQLMSQSLIDTFGTSALCLDDKPALLKRFLSELKIKKP